jgi:hypothetical protein
MRNTKTYFAHLQFSLAFLGQQTSQVDQFGIVFMTARIQILHLPLDDIPSVDLYIENELTLLVTAEYSSLHFQVRGKRQLLRS